MPTPLFLPRRAAGAPAPAPARPFAGAAARGREAAALVLAASAAFAALALASFEAHPARPDAHGPDWVGPVGAALASALATSVGVVAWALVLELASLAWPLLRARASSATLARLAGDVLILLIVASLVHVAAPDARAFGGLAAGGTLGELFGELLRSLFSTVGSFLVGLTAVGLILIGRSSLSLAAWLERARLWAARAAAALAAAYGALRAFVRRWASVTDEVGAATTSVPSYPDQGDGAHPWARDASWGRDATTPPAAAGTRPEPPPAAGELDDRSANERTGATAPRAPRRDAPRPGSLETPEVAPAPADAGLDGAAPPPRRARGRAKADDPAPDLAAMSRARGGSRPLAPSPYEATSAADDRPVAAPVIHAGEGLASRAHAGGALAAALDAEPSPARPLPPVALEPTPSTPTAEPSGALRRSAREALAPRGAGPDRPAPRIDPKRDASPSLAAGAALAELGAAPFAVEAGGLERSRAAIVAEATRPDGLAAPVAVEAEAFDRRRAAGPAGAPEGRRAATPAASGERRPSDLVDHRGASASVERKTGAATPAERQARAGAPAPAEEEDGVGPSKARGDGPVGERGGAQTEQRKMLSASNGRAAAGPPARAMAVRKPASAVRFVEGEEALAADDLDDEGGAFALVDGADADATPPDDARSAAGGRRVDREAAAARPVTSGRSGANGRALERPPAAPRVAAEGPSVETVRPASVAPSGAGADGGPARAESVGDPGGEHGAAAGRGGGTVAFDASEGRGSPAVARPRGGGAFTSLERADTLPAATTSERPPAGAVAGSSGLGRTPPEGPVASTPEGVGRAAPLVHSGVPEAGGARGGERARVVPAWGEGFRLPGAALLEPPPASTPREEPEALLARARDLEKVLANYGVKGAVADIHTGPTVSTFEVIPAEGTKVSKVASLADDLALGLSCTVRIIAPIPGKSRIGFELPNRERIPVNLRELVEDRRFRESGVPLPVVLGRDIVGAPYYADLASMPHVIVAGATGAGKSVGLNVMLTSLLTRRGPDELRMLMIDPKVVELAPFDRIPHMLLPVVTDMKQAATALKWAVDEMERRYQLFASAGTKNIGTYNAWVARARRGEIKAYRASQGASMTTDDGTLVEVGPARAAPPPPEPLPYIVIVVDEFADLMMQQGKDVEAAVARLAQKARAAGMHVILATQRPSVDVITGMIKANFPTRVAFRVAQRVDSRTILDEQGAEHLLGRGDMLVKLNGTNETRRVQCPFISEEEVQRVTDFLRAQGEPVYDENILKPRDDEGAAAADDDGELDPKYDEAVRVVAETRRCSTSWLQRKLGLGYNRAAKIVEAMEKRGLVGPAHGARDREVLIDPL